MQNSTEYEISIIIQWNSAIKTTKNYDILSIKNLILKV